VEEYVAAEKMAKRNVFVGLGALLVLGLGVAWAKGDWSSAKGKVDELRSKQIDLRKLVPEEVRKIVKSAGEDADEDEREKVAKEAADRVAYNVSRELSNLRRTRDEANQALDDVLNDADLKSNYDDAKNLKDDIDKRWRSIEKMANNAMRGGNHPIVSYLSQRGIREHQDYQRNSSNCHAYEFKTGSRIADCLYADGENCFVIELKPNNSRAISKGTRQAQDSVDDLNKALAAKEKGEKPSVLDDLTRANSRFASCKRFQRRLMCYTLCPQVDDEGDYREGSVSWTSCS